MTKLTSLLLAAAVMSGSTPGTVPAQRPLTMPPETAAVRASDLPGYSLVQRHCSTCHSAHYVTTQPPASSRTYWDATVRKMKKPFGAQFPDEDVPAMVDYLVKTYGAERGGAADAKRPRQ
jgi:sulfite dehydrogenase